MKILAWLLSGINVYFGLRCLLNAVGVLQTSKYSQTTTVIFAVLFLGLGAAGFYCSIVRHDAKLALLVSLGPWLLALVVLLFTMMTSSYQ